jgi:mRNA interferase MazF
LNRGEIRWYTFRPPDKRRPVLILARTEVIERINEIIVVPATRTIRGLSSEVVLSEDDGMPTTCALNFDHVSLAQRARIGSALADTRRVIFSGGRCSTAPTSLLRQQHRPDKADASRDTDSSADSAAA